MMDGAFDRVVAQWGQAVTVHDPDGTEKTGKAFIQPVLDRREDWKQEVPTPLGLRRRDRFLYLGEPTLSMVDMEGGWVTWMGQAYTVQAAQPIYTGGTLSHWWGVLTPRDEGER